MARADIRSILYSRDKSPLEFKFDSLIAPPLLSYITIEDIQRLYNIASSVKYSSKIELKYKEIDKIMKARGFVKFHSGTNRIVYRPLESNLFIVKIAVDRVGLRDNPMEYKNQFLLKPFVTKVFEVSPCGTIGSFERVQPFTSRQEFASVAEDIFMLINDFIIGKYVLEDIGTKYFMNWGIRPGFGAVLLDFPYVYELDGKKLYCNTKIPELGYRPCGGVIDYDDGFNNLVCTKCGKRYLATELKKEDSSIKIISEGDDLNMKVQLFRGDQVVKVNETGTDSIIKPNVEDKTKQPKVYRNETIVTYGQGPLGSTVILTTRTGKKNKDQMRNFMNDYGYKNRTKVPMPKEIEEELKIEEEQEKMEKEVVFTPDFEVENKEKEEKVTIKMVERDTVTNNGNIYPQEVLETIETKQEEITEEQEVKEEESEVVSAIDTNNIHINKQGSDMLKIYGLSEEDFEEPQDDYEEKYGDLASQYEDEPNYQKINKSPKQFY